MFPLRVCRCVRHMRQCIHLCQHSFVSYGVLWGTCASAWGRGLRSLAVSVVCSCTRASACVEPALVSLCSQRSSITHMRVDPSCLLWRHSTFEHSFWIVPSLPFPIFPLYILYQCDGCPSSLLRGGSWLGCQDLPAMGAVSSRSWLPIVEAPGCLGHPTCI